MPVVKTIQTLFLCLLLIIVSGCGKSDKPVSEAEGAIKQLVTSAWDLKDLSIEDFSSGPETGTYFSTFSGKAVAKQAMGVSTQNISGTNIVKPTLKAGDAVQIYGKLAAVKRGETWLVEAKLESDNVFSSRFDPKPMDSLKPYILVGSPELEEFVKKIEETKLVEARAREAEITAQQKAREEAETLRRKNIELAQVEREKDAKEAREAKEKLRQEEYHNKMKRRFDAFTTVNGFRVIHNGLSRWGMTCTAMKKDLDTYTFSGFVIDRSKLPFTTATFKGRIASKGQLVLQFSHISGDVVMDDFNDKGAYTSREWAAFRISADELASIRKEDDLATRLAKASLPKVAARIIKKDDRDAFMQQLKWQPLAGDMAINGKPANDGMKIIDGDPYQRYINFSRGDVTEIRARATMMAKGLIVVSDTSGMNDAVQNVTFSINGSSRFDLPVIPGSSVLVLEFEKPVELYSAGFEAFANQCRIVEIGMIPE